MWTKRDCFNTRVKSQGESRADKVTSSRGRGNGIIQETRLNNYDRLMEVQSSWASIPNVAPHSSSTRYGDPQVKNCGNNPFRMDHFPDPPLLPSSLSEYMSVPPPIDDFSKENKLWFEDYQKQGENTGYSLFGKSSDHGQQQTLKAISGNQINLQPLDRRFNCVDQRQETKPLRCIIKEKSLQEYTPNPNRPLSWSQVVAEVKVPTVPAGGAAVNERIKIEDSTSTASTSLDTETDKSLDVSVFDPVTEGRNSKKYISDSFVINHRDDRLFSLLPPLPSYLVIKVQNVPWCASSEDLNNLIKKSSYFSVPSVKELPHNVHVIMDKYTGKTCGVAFIQVKVKSNVTASQDAINLLSSLPLQGRRLKFFISSYDELRQKLFSTYSGTFKNGLAIPFKDNQNQAHPDNDSLAPKGTVDFFIGQRDLQSVLQISRNYKVFYNRKCPERSFEYIMSITMNIPWLQLRAVTTCQRDIIYECYKLATDYLRTHTSKPLHSFHNSLVPRFIRTAIVCDGFTVRQKLNILKTAHQTCPPDLVEYITIEEKNPNPEPTAPMNTAEEA